MGAKKTLELTVYAVRRDSDSGEVEAKHDATFKYVGVSMDEANKIDASLLQAGSDHAGRMVKLGIEHAAAKASA